MIKSKYSITKLYLQIKIFLISHLYTIACQIHTIVPILASPGSDSATDYRFVLMFSKHLQRDMAWVLAAYDARRPFYAIFILLIGSLLTYVQS